MSTVHKIQAYGGDIHLDAQGTGATYGGILKMDFPIVASLADGVAIATVQGRLAIPGPHRILGVGAQFSGATVVAAGTDPAIDVYQHLPVPTAPVAVLAGAGAGNVNAGAHQYAVQFLNATGDGTVSHLSNIVTTTSGDGKVTVTIPLGPDGTTGRKLFRTKAGAPTVLYLHSTIADNTTTTVTDNTADSGTSGSIAASNAAPATILASTLKLSSAAITLVDQPLAGTLATGVWGSVYSDRLYTLHALTGATTGALANLQAWLLVELLPA